MQDGAGVGGASCGWGQTAGWPEETLLDVISGPEMHPQQGKLLQCPYKYKVLYKH